MIPVRLSGSALATVAASVVGLGSAQDAQQVQGLRARANCSPVNPATKRPPRISPEPPCAAGQAAARARAVDRFAREQIAKQHAPARKQLFARSVRALVPKEPPRAIRAPSALPQWRAGVPSPAFAAPAASGRSEPAGSQIHRRSRDRPR